MKLRGAVAVALLAIPVVAVTPAHAASTRAEYVTQAEAICQAPGHQLFKLDQQVKQLGRRHDLKPRQVAVRLGKIFGRLASIEGAILAQLGTLTPAPGDEAIIAAWLQGLQRTKGLTGRAARAGKHGQLRKFVGLLRQALTAGQQADQIVAGFGFRACVFG